MKTDTRQTFEEAYRQTVCESAIYELKLERPEASLSEVTGAAILDAQKVNLLLDTLCSDMSDVLGRRSKRVSQMNYRVMPAFRANWPKVYLKEYSTRMPVLVQKVISGLVQAPPYTLRTGWINWSGWDATTTLVDNQFKSHMIHFPEAEEISIEEMKTIPPHVQKLLLKLKESKFNYQPYIFTGTNGEKVLAVRLGCMWHDLAIARWTPDPHMSAIQVQIALLLVAMLGCITSVSLAFQFDSWIPTILMIVGAVVSGLGTAFMAMLVSDHFRPIRV